MTTRAQVIAEARGWLGASWRHQGRTRAGVDCVGLVVKVAHALGLSEFDSNDYARQATDETLLAICREHLVEVPIAEMQTGDIVLMRFGTQRHLAFLGDYTLGGLSLIHAYALHPRKVVEVRLAPKMQEKIVAAFRFPQVTD